jgi:hypothetical protein
MTVATAVNSDLATASAHPAGPCAIVIFGAAGDLTKRLLMPALYNLAHTNLLPKDFAIVGVAHTSMSQDDFRHKLRQEIQEFATVSVDNQLWQQLEQRLYYLSGEFQDPTLTINCKTCCSRLIRNAALKAITSTIWQRPLIFSVTSFRNWVQRDWFKKQKNIGDESSSKSHLDTILNLHAH